MIKYLIMDVDGTLTDGKIYMGSDGEIMKAFSVKDGCAINFILKPAGIEPVIITARTSPIVQQRGNELGITEVYQGKMDKLTALKEIVGEDNIGSCAYFGDDILDLQCMLPIKAAGGIIGCPADAVQKVKAVADYLCINKAGEGALREFSEWIVKPKVDVEEIERRVKDAAEYLKHLNITEADSGSKVVVNEKFFYSIQSYETKSEEECNLESHRNYIDIQIIVEGSEAMDIVDISKLIAKETYNEKQDVIFWNIPHLMCRTTLRAGDCIVLYPENAHRGAVSITKKEKVLKIIGKISMW